MTSKKAKKSNLLNGARVYLSGPMDFVGSRAKEKASGWRARVSLFLKRYGATVFDPWFKPIVKGIGIYGEEDEKSTELRETVWTFENSRRGAQAREKCSRAFWETLHVDLRMVDLSDFIVACIPSHIYSVGTVHEIALARQQNKPVLLVSPRISIPALQEMDRLAAKDAQLKSCWKALNEQIPIKKNPTGAPSIWYMALVKSDCFFDCFGFEKYERRFRWPANEFLDERDSNRANKRPLLPFLEKLAQGTLPKRYDHRLKRMTEDDDWCLLEMPRAKA